MKSPGTVPIAGKLSIMIEKITGVVSGVHRHRPIPGIFVRNLKSRKTDFTDIILRDLNCKTAWSGIVS
jgi:hypothetical protein